MLILLPTNNLNLQIVQKTKNINQKHKRLIINCKNFTH